VVQGQLDEIDHHGAIMEYQRSARLDLSCVE